jgi:formyl-CoA transferase
VAGIEGGVDVVKALEGLRVIDFTQAMAAPFGTMNLADMGADVIKIEPPVTGEPTRELSSVTQNGHSATFMTMNRSKRGLTVDLKTPEGVDVVKRLAKTADVFVQNYRPGVAERLGLGYEALSAVNPRLIYCSVSGFGGTGPYAPRGGYDLIAQGMSGIISVTGDEDAPAKSGVPLSDLCAGLFAAYGILCALEYRERTGLGQLVDTSLLEAAMALTVWESTEYWVTGRAPSRSAPRIGSPRRIRPCGRRTGTSTSARTTTSCSRGCARPSGGRTFATTRASPRAPSGWSIAPRSSRPSRRPPPASRAPTGWRASSTRGSPRVPSTPMRKRWSIRTRWRGRWWSTSCTRARGRSRPSASRQALGHTRCVDRPAPLLGQHTADILTELGYTEAEQRALRDRGVT